MPTTIADDLANEPPLLSDFPDQLVDIHDVGLELDHEDGASAGRPGDDVDDATLPVDRVRHLRREDPGRQLLPEPSSHELVELRMPGIQQSIEIAGAPARHEVDADVERRRDPADDVERK